ncbi:unnamed protein product, partial [Linum tenue]
TNFALHNPTFIFLLSRHPVRESFSPPSTLRNLSGAGAREYTDLLLQEDCNYCKLTGHIVSECPTLSR